MLSRLEDPVACPAPVLALLPVAAVDVGLGSERGRLGGVEARATPGTGARYLETVSAPTLLPPAALADPDQRADLVRRARLLSWLSIGWMAIEAGVAIVAALVAGSVALLGFGLDSLIEMGSAATILWLWSGTRAGNQAAERRAQQVIAASFFALAAYLTYDAISTLAGGAHPEASWPGVAISIGAIIIMPLLARAKNQVAVELGSAATSGDAAQSWLCAIAAGGVLVSVIANAALGWWWLDPVIGLGIVGLAIHEGREAWAGEICADCAPVGYEAKTSCDDQCCS